MQYYYRLLDIAQSIIFMVEDWHFHCFLPGIELKSDKNIP